MKSPTKRDLVLHPAHQRDPYAALRFMDFRLLLAGRFISISRQPDVVVRHRLGIMAAHTERARTGSGRIGTGYPGGRVLAACRARGGPIQPQTDRAHHADIVGDVLDRVGVALVFSRADYPDIRLPVRHWDGARFQRPGRINFTAANSASSHLHQRRHLEQQRMAAGCDHWTGVGRAAGGAPE